MLTFSVNGVRGNEEYVLKVQRAIADNIMYFKKFNGPNWEEAVQKAFITAVLNQNDNYEDVEPYIKNLARNILKTQEVEKAYDTITEDGEVSYPYLKLVSNIDESIFIDNKEVEDTFKELYLLYPEDFLKLEILFKAETEEVFKLNKSETIRNIKLKEAIQGLCMKYGTSDIFYRLYTFLNKLEEYLRPYANVTIKTIEMKPRSPKTLDLIPDIPLIKDKKGNFLGINKSNLTMDVDPDYIEWDTINTTSCDILKIDISPLMDYMYQQVFVPQGVHTKHITWCRDMYRLTTPSGVKVVNMDRNKFMNLVKVELIENLIDSRFNTVVAISPDSVYIKPSRVVLYDTIRLVLTTGKNIDLKITTHIKKRH